VRVRERERERKGGREREGKREIILAKERGRNEKLTLLRRKSITLLEGFHASPVRPSYRNGQKVGMKTSEL